MARIATNAATDIPAWMAADLASADMVRRAGEAAQWAMAQQADVTGVVSTWGNTGTHQLGGRLLEIQQSATHGFNAIQNDSPYRIFTTDSLGAPHDPADLMTVDMRNGDTVGRAQAKNIENEYTRNAQLSQDKYSGMDHVVPEEHVASTPSAKGTVASPDGVSSDQTSRSDLTEDPLRETIAQREKEVAAELRTIGTAALAGGIIGFSLGALISAIRSSKTVRSGAMTIREAALRALLEGVKGGARGAIIGGAGAWLSLNTEMGGAAPFVAVSIAITVVEAAWAAYQGRMSWQHALHVVGKSVAQQLFGLAVYTGFTLIGLSGLAAAGLSLLIMTGLAATVWYAKRLNAQLHRAREEAEDAKLLAEAYRLWAQESRAEIDALLAQGRVCEAFGGVDLDPDELIADVDAGRPIPLGHRQARLPALTQ